MKKFFVVLSLILCFCFVTVVCAADFDNFEEDFYVELDDSPADPAEADVVPAPDFSKPFSDLEQSISSNNMILANAIDSLSKSLAKENSDIDYMSLVPMLQQCGFNVEFSSDDFCILIYTFTDNYIFVTHTTMLNLGDF